MIGSTNSIWDINIKYEQLVNYTMLYDYGDECLDVGSSWTKTSSYGTLTKNANNLTLYLNNTSGVGKQVDATKKEMSINPSIYTKYGIISHIKGGCFRLRMLLNDANDQYLIDLEDSDNPSDSSHGVSNRDMDINRIFDFPNLSNSNLNSMKVAYYCATLLNRTPLTMNIYGIFLTKADDWQTLAEKAKITASSIDDILTSSIKLLSNKRAVEFMIYNCTGDFMASAVLSQTFLTALNNSPYKTIIMANEHWAKFLNMVA